MVPIVRQAHIAQLSAPADHRTCAVATEPAERGSLDPDPHLVPETEIERPCLVLAAPPSLARRRGGGGGLASRCRARISTLVLERIELEVITDPRRLTGALQRAVRRDVAARVERLDVIADQRFDGRRPPIHPDRAGPPFLGPARLLLQQGLAAGAAREGDRRLRRGRLG